MVKLIFIIITTITITIIIIITIIITAISFAIQHWSYQFFSASIYQPIFFFHRKFLNQNFLFFILILRLNPCILYFAITFYAFIIFKYIYIFFIKKKNQPFEPDLRINFVHKNQIIFPVSFPIHLKFFWM